MPVPFRVVAVDGSSDAASAAGAAILAAGHALVDRVDITQDDLPHQVLQARGFQGITVVCGGQDAAAVVGAVRDQLDSERTGVAELFRQRLFAQIGAPAALAELACGPSGAGVIVAVPGGATEVTVALADLVVPLAEHLVPEVEAEVAPPPPGRVELSQLGSEPTPTEQGIGGASGSGWEAGLLAMGGTIDRSRFPPLPSSFDRLAPAKNVLETAGERGLVTLPDGRSYAAFGFPDLLRARSKVLLVAEGEPLAEIVALHRFPRRVGVTVHGESSYLPSADLDPDGPAIERTGSPCPGFGTLFAVDGSAVYYLRDRKVHSWDGSKERDEGAPSQALASLLLRWSQR